MKLRGILILIVVILMNVTSCTVMKPPYEFRTTSHNSINDSNLTTSQPSRLPVAFHPILPGKPRRAHGRTGG